MRNISLPGFRAAVANLFWSVNYLFWIIGKAFANIYNL